MGVTVKNLFKRFEDKVVINDVSFSVHDGETLAIVGFSGSGKSTILKMISHLIKPDGGRIELGDNQSTAMVFQYSALFDSLNVFDNISFPLVERRDLRGKFTPEQINDIVMQKLKLVGLEGVEYKFPHELSGGMQKRVGFARAIVTDPKIILYDEPTSGLDPVSSTLIEDYIVRLKNELNVASIVVTHQISTIKRCADSVIMLYDGKIVYQGRPTDLEYSDNPYARQFVTASIEGPMKIANSNV